MAPLVNMGGTWKQLLQTKAESSAPNTGREGQCRGTGGCPLLLSPSQLPQSRSGHPLAPLHSPAPRPKPGSSSTVVRVKGTGLEVISFSGFQEARVGSGDGAQGRRDIMASWHFAFQSFLLPPAFPLPNWFLGFPFPESVNHPWAQLTCQIPQEALSDFRGGKEGSPAFAVQPAGTCYWRTPPCGSLHPMSAAEESHTRFPPVQIQGLLVHTLDSGSLQSQSQRHVTDSHEGRSWEVPQPAPCKLEAQESPWCDSVPV